MFVEYHLLYITSSDYRVGSTVYPGHNATTNWLVDMGGHYYDIGALGLQYSFQASLHKCFNKK